MNPFWLHNYNGFEPNDTKQGHWGKGQTGFNVSISGIVNLSDNRKVKKDGAWRYPNHRDMMTGEGDHCTCLSGIYSWGYEEGPTLYLYPAAEGMMNERIREGLASLIGVHHITEDTPVVSNCSRKILFRLGEVRQRRAA